VAAGLAWDAGRRALRHPGPEGAPARTGPLPARRRRFVVIALVAAGVAYAGVVGSFSRYSWPATAGIIGLSTVVVLIGWHGPVRARPDGERPPVAGTLAWLVVLVAGCLWELSSLLQQPSLTTDSYAHPTISTLTDPLMATSPGRMLVLFAWVAFGWYLAER